MADAIVDNAMLERLASSLVSPSGRTNASAAF
jgi:hypothetical protein